MREYLDFDLHIEKTERGYRARVLNSPSGQASSDFDLPFSDIEVENFWLRVGRTRSGVRSLRSPEMATAQQFGTTLFKSVFSDDVSGCLHSSLVEAEQREAGLRIRLRLSNAPELVDLPWEYLYNPSVNRFLSLSVETPLVRYLDFPGRIQPLTVAPPLRVLVMISSPHDYPALDAEQEWDKLRQSVAGLEQRGVLSLERMEDSTLVALQHKLRRGKYHIFHYIGHGGFDTQAQDGILLLEDDQGRGRSVSGQYLGMLLHDHRTMRLAMLNACEGARTSRADPFSGVGQNLLQQGIPAVIAMQSEITDEAAITLSYEFYSALADGYPVDAALVEARKAIFAQENDVEWGTPVLFLRAPDGRIFDLEKAPAVVPEAAPSAAVATSAGADVAGASTPAAEARPVRAATGTAGAAATAATAAAAPAAAAARPAGHEAVAQPAAPAGSGGAQGRSKLWLGLAAVLALVVVGAAAFLIGGSRGSDSKVQFQTPEPQAGVAAAVPTEAAAVVVAGALAEGTATDDEAQGVGGESGDAGSDLGGTALPSPGALGTGDLVTEPVGVSAAILDTETVEEATLKPAALLEPTSAPTDLTQPSATKASLPTAAPEPTSVPTTVPDPTSVPTDIPTTEAAPTNLPTDAPESTATVAIPPTPAAPVINGRIAYSAKGRLYIVDAISGKEVAPPIDGMRQPSFGRNGAELLANGEGSRATIVNINANTGAILLDQGNFTDDYHPFWSPDSSRFVYDSLHSGLGKGKKLYVQDVTGTNKAQPDIQLTFDGFHIPGTSPVWTAGQEIAFTGCDYWPGGTAGNDCGIFRIPETGGQPKLVHRDTVDARATDTSGAQLVYMSRETGDWEVYVIPVEGGAGRNLSQSPGSHDGLGSFSPDGKAVAFMSSRDGAWAVWAVNLDGSGLTRLFNLADVPTEPWFEDSISWGR